MLGSLAEAAAGAEAGDSGAVADGLTTAGQELGNGLVNNFVPIIGFAVAAVLVAWGGRKYGRSATNVSRKWRVI